MTTAEKVDAAFAAAGYPDPEDAMLMGDGGSDLTDLRKVCTDTIEAYIAEIAEMTVSLKEANELTTKMAGALSKIDPNTKNSEEGEAFLRKMYKMRGKSARPSQAFMPQTP